MVGIWGCVLIRICGRGLFKIDNVIDSSDLAQLAESARGPVSALKEWSHAMACRRSGLSPDTSEVIHLDRGAELVWVRAP